MEQEIPGSERRRRPRAWRRVAPLVATSGWLLGPLVTACGVAQDLPAGVGGFGGAEAGVADLALVQFVPANQESRSAARIAVPTTDRPFLFEGELSAANLAQLSRGSLSQSLSERWVASASWQEDGLWWISPESMLSPDRYSVVTQRGGLLEQFDVEAPVVALRRAWPLGESIARRDVLFCADDDALAIRGDVESVELMPNGVRAQVTPAQQLYGPAARHCAQLEIEESATAGWVAAPSVLFDHVVVPKVLRFAAVDESAPVDAPSCLEHELSLSHGCLAIQDDRLSVKAIGASLWTFEAPSLARLRTVRANEGFLLLGLDPGSSFDLSVRVLGEEGSSSQVELRVQTAPAQPHLVISEVMANPLGAEPAQEWIELYNSGRLTVNLDGYQLVDGAGATLLPAFELAPGEFLLLLNEAFTAGGADVPIPEDANQLRLPRLGTSGLSNSGERLELRDPSGRGLSIFPALPASEAGVSLARRDAETLDDSSDGFGAHQDGASPGAPNRLRAP